MAKTKILGSYMTVSKEEVKRILLKETTLDLLAKSYLNLTPDLKSFNDEEKKKFKELYPELFL